MLRLPAALVHSGRHALTGALLALMLAAPAAAEPATGEELTPFGALRAGNRTGTIPAWTGGMSSPPPEYVPGRHLRDPFLEDTRWFTVTPAELERYRSRLSAGLATLLQRYPSSFEIPMFPTRRTAAAPPRILEASTANLGRARLTDNGLAVAGAQAGIPFPVPKTGEQAMWNHMLRWRGGAVSRTTAYILPDERGVSVPVTYREDWLSPYSAGSGDGVALHYRRIGLRPAEAAGAALLIRQSLNPLQQPPAVWYRPPGARAQPVRAPDFAYDTPDPMTGGLRTADMTDMFSGMLDRFEFQLIGRKEMYVPYNAWRLLTPDLRVEEVFWSAHPNPTLLRYELHRVWVVEATLKQGLRHAFPRRVYYLDEDSWQILMADHFTADGSLARYAEVHGIVHPQVPVFLPGVEIAYDFASNRYVASSLDVADKPPAFDAPLTPQDFAPEALLPKRR